MTTSGHVTLAHTARRAPDHRAPAVAGAAPGAEEALAARALTIARRTALGVLGDAAAADDVAQEVAIIALRRRGSLRDAARIDAWLHRIAVRAALREGRRAGRRRSVEAALPGGLHASHQADDGDPATAAAALLAVLPHRQRAALTLRYVHDLPDDAIAAALGCRTGTVRSLLSRGREALRAAHPHLLDPKEPT